MEQRTIRSSRVETVRQRKKQTTINAIGATFWSSDKMYYERFSLIILKQRPIVANGTLSLSGMLKCLLVACRCCTRSFPVPSRFSTADLLLSSGPDLGPWIPSVGVRPRYLTT